ncbi:nicotinate (nicotinamide) nucleotide adenylyltransferase [Agaribacter marinus]|uniref:Probable nicotinate-nucleotide adenylyltransferase n=1 Tax=Agaribacter marinus TaxID=1431249 RepID=A0AA37WHY6_9ALTE|nr:nicotinate (nicotinamide) nucleotide adenylyltransferase [Agaribacter marinus]GLR70488.1 putative nicotinate-nucleotide adenylyltransferase [Agaribacter marinus]
MIKAFFGGTFDPPHLGHFQSIDYIQTTLAIRHIDVLPCHIPPHKVSIANEAARLAMCELFIKTRANLSINTFELEQNAPSYTFDTLQYLRRQFPSDCLIFIVGEDSWQNFTTWYRWQDILSMCHLLVMPRKAQQTMRKNNLLTLPEKGSSLPISINSANIYDILPPNSGNFPKNRKKTHNLDKFKQVSIEQMHQILNNTTHGSVFMTNGSYHDISSTEIRRAIQAKQDVSEWIPEPVLNYIKTNNLYQIGDD